MRKLFYILILSFTVLKSSADLYQDRGFKENSCYLHIAKFNCDATLVNCSLTLFKNSPGALSFKIANPEAIKTQVKKNQTYFNTKFKLEKNGKAWAARVLESNEALSLEVVHEQKTKNFMGHKISCDN